MPFFSNAGPGGFEPKRKFRFLVSFTGIQNIEFMATKVNKPSYDMTPKEHQILNHVFKFPGIIKWSDVQVSFVDAVDPNIGSRFYNALLNAGYIQPTRFNNTATGITKVQAKSALGDVVIKQLNGGGVDVPAGVDTGTFLGNILDVSYVEQWTLKNAFIKGVKFGDLDYSSEDLVGIDIDVVYDYAEYVDYGPGGETLQDLG